MDNCDVSRAGYRNNELFVNKDDKLLNDQKTAEHFQTMSLPLLLPSSMMITEVPTRPQIVDGTKL